MTTTGACVIPLISKFDMKDLQYIKHLHKMTDAQATEHYTEVQVPTLDSGGASDEEFFFFLSRFHPATTIMEWQDGKRLLQNVERHLYGTFLSNWESILDLANDEAKLDAAGLPIHDHDFFQEVIANYTTYQINKAKWTEQAD
jgi:hypothetical protein